VKSIETVVYISIVVAYIVGFMLGILTAKDPEYCEMIMKMKEVTGSE